MSSGFATSIYAAMQERYFGTFFQRALSAPLDVRMRYGHPDLVDKLHFMTRGGVSQASKFINLSEDVFAGYKTTLRGGRSIFKEYHQLGKGRGVNLSEVNGFFAKLSMDAAYQLQSRDVYRLCKLLPLERRAALFSSAFGFYVSNAVTMYSVQLTAWLFAILAVGNLLTTYAGMLTSLVVISTYMPYEPWAVETSPKHVP
jgi:callose synthase